MEPERYGRLLTELEELARANPRRLRRRVRLLIALGYGYVLLVLCATIGLVVALGWIALTGRAGGLLVKLAIPLLVLVHLIARALWVRTEAPAGRVLARGQAPELDARVEEIRRALDAPRADVVLLTDDFNASVTQVPRLGIFGWSRTYLVLGMPLMVGLSPSQFDAVLAHEFAHLSGSHPKLGLWVFRMSQTWHRLLAHLEESSSWGSKLFERFVRWYQPMMQAHGFVLSRRDEYEADADAARVTGGGAMAEALVALELRSRTLTEQFWPGVWHAVEERPDAPERSWSRLATVFRDVVPAPVVSQWVGSALSRRALEDDTHPSLRERLLALGVGDAVPEQLAGLTSRVASPATHSAAERYLGELAVEVLSHLDREWHTAVAEPWKSRHDELQEHRARVTELLRRDAEGPPLDATERWALAASLLQVDRDEEGRTHLRQLLQVEPGHALAHLVLGQSMLDAHDAVGADHLREAMRLAPDELTPHAAGLLRDFFAAQGNDGALRETQRVLHEHHVLMEMAREERREVRRDDLLAPAELPESDRELLRSVAAADARVRRLWVARKVTRHLPHSPMIVVLVEATAWRVGSVVGNDRKLAQELLAAIELSGSGYVMVFVLDRSTSWLRKKVEGTADAELFRR